MSNANAIERLFRSVKLRELLKTFYPVLHLMTGPPPLERNGGIWKSVKKHMSEVLDAPNIMVQAFHFTTYNLSKNSWNAWTGTGENNLSNQIRTHFPGGSIFVDSGGYQFLQGDKVDLSKWDIEANQEGIYELQRKYGADKICNLDKPIGLYQDATEFKESVEENLSNIRKLRDVLKSDRSDVYLVVHGRNWKEIDYFYNRVKQEIDLSEERIHFALGSQVPLFNVSKNLIADNANYLLRLVNRDFGKEKLVHIFGVGSNIIRHVNDIVDISYDNSTFVRSAMYHRWYDPKKTTYSDFTPSSLETCDCRACSTLSEIGSTTIIDLFSGRSAETGFTKSDIMGLIALHNIYCERFRVATTSYSHSNFPKLDFGRVPQTKREYRFPLRRYKPSAKKLVILECSARKPYSQSSSHKKIKTRIKEKTGLEESSDYDVITMSGLYGPVHWKDERQPEIMSYDFRLTNATSRQHISSLQTTTATIMSIVAKKYELSYSILGGIYYRTFVRILQNLGVKTFRSVNDFEP